MSGTSRVRTALALALTAVALLSRLWFVVHQAYDIDEFEHAHATWCVSRGLVPYVDFFEHHTPWLYFLFAPLFHLFDTDSDPIAAARLLQACRLSMLAITASCVVLTYRLAKRRRGEEVAALAALLFATSSQAAANMLDFRPDVPALFCFLLSMNALAADRYALGGLGFGAALMFTQKYLFGVPGLAIAMLLDPHDRMQRVIRFAIGAVIPFAATVAWFVAHHAFDAFWYYAGAINVPLNEYTFPALPRIVSNAVHDPVLYVLGLGGVAAAVWRVRNSRDPLVPVVASFLAGIFLIGRSHDQYYVMFLPLLAVFAADVLRTALARRQEWTAGVFFVVILLFSLVMQARGYQPIEPQLADMTYVTTHTGASETVLGTTPGPGVFRPHAWFYFFLTGPFASDADYARLRDALESGRLKPRIAVLQPVGGREWPEEIAAFVRQHYRRVGDDVFDRVR